jgi:hypothetical protein
MDQAEKTRRHHPSTRQVDPLALPANVHGQFLALVTPSGNHTGNLAEQWHVFGVVYLLTSSPA